MYRKHGRAERAMALLREMPGGLEASDEFSPLVAETLEELEGAQSAVAWLRQATGRHADWYAARYTLGKLLLSLRRVAGRLARVPLAAASAAGALRSARPRRCRRAWTACGCWCATSRASATRCSSCASPASCAGAAPRSCLAVPRKLMAVLGDAGGCEVLAEEEAPAARFERAIWGGDLPALLETADSAAGLRAGARRSARRALPAPPGGARPGALPRR